MFCLQPAIVMHIDLSEGIPTATQYLEVVAKEPFTSMETFSAEFLKRYHRELEYYRTKWVSDPLHQWSRQWEYPYVFQQIKRYGTKNSGTTILDAGSGITFFPFFIHKELKQAGIRCCDYDEQLEPLYSRITADRSADLQFRHADLHRLPYEERSFDIIYCISVLEHTIDHLTILREFRRVLKPGGRLIVTFDISLDGKGDISIEQSKQLLNDLQQLFAFEAYDTPQFLAQASDPDMLTTKSDCIPDRLLPWGRPGLLEKMKYFIRHAALLNYPPAFSFCCVSLIKED